MATWNYLKNLFWVRNNNKETHTGNNVTAQIPKACGKNEAGLPESHKVLFAAPFQKSSLGISWITNHTRHTHTHTHTLLSVLRHYRNHCLYKSCPYFALNFDVNHHILGQKDGYSPHYVCVNTHTVYYTSTYTKFTCQYSVLKWRCISVVMFQLGILTNLTSWQPKDRAVQKHCCPCFILKTPVLHPAVDWQKQRCLEFVYST